MKLQLGTYNRYITNESNLSNCENKSLHIKKHYVHACMRAYVHLYICTYVHMYICTYVHMYICTYVHMYICTYV